MARVGRVHAKEVNPNCGAFDVSVNGERVGHFTANDGQFCIYASAISGGGVKLTSGDLAKIAKEMRKARKAKKTQT